MSRKASLGLLMILAAVVVVVCGMMPRFAQPLSYHLFADRRSFLGIPNFADVASNLPFAVIGIWGIVFLLRIQSGEKAAHFPSTFPEHFIDRRERVPYLFVFLGLLLTAFGSTYYHLAPNNASLVWDRLPMTITFMSLVAAVIAERISPRLGLWLLPILMAVGLASVLQWDWSEMHGAGDLRFYAGVQVYAVFVVLLALLFPRRYTHASWFAFVFGFYILAKVLELYDKPIFAFHHVVSGHTLKHLAAAAAGYWILRMLRTRRPVVAVASE